MGFAGSRKDMRNAPSGRRSAQEDETGIGRDRYVRIPLRGEAPMYTERTSNTAPRYDLCLDGPYCADPEAVQPDEENVCIDPATTVESKRTGHDLLDSAIVGFTSASLSFGSSLKDEKKILEFLEGAKRVVDELLLDVELGKLTFEQATEELHRLRGTLELQTEAAT